MFCALSKVSIDESQLRSLLKYFGEQVAILTVVISDAPFIF